MYQELCATVEPPLNFYYRYTGKVDYNGYGNDIGYADATEMVSWCEGNLTLLLQKTKKLLWTACAFIGCHPI